MSATNPQTNIVSRPTVMGGYQAVTIDAMTNHKGRTAITVCCSAAVVVLAAGCGGASAESPSSATTSPTMTTTKSPFSNLTQEPPPPATSGGQTGSGGADAFPGLSFVEDMSAADDGDLLGKVQPDAP
jgi:hypothetical protein